jgi:hypothetical protein
LATAYPSVIPAKAGIQKKDVAEKAHVFRFALGAGADVDHFGDVTEMVTGHAYMLTRCSAGSHHESRDLRATPC